MCGIAGWVGDGAERSTVEAMCSALTHRGPDDDGFFHSMGVSMGARRLSIIDVESGGQPVFNEDRSVVLVFNGEIYNYEELRAALRSRGHNFSTNSDTECIVHLYEDEGPDCVESLRGMFAIAIWDIKKKRLMLARDRVGKKPLFYSATPDGIAFASELKALRLLKEFDTTIDPQSIHNYLSYQYVPCPDTIYSHTKKLPPGNVLLWEAGGAPVTRRYWTLKYEPKLAISLQEAAEETRGLLLESTRLRLISERPVGAFLSGGMDSSAVVAAMSRLSVDPIRTFSIGFEDKRFNELDYARLVANQYQTDHTELVLRPTPVELLPRIVRQYDEPFADSSAIPTFYVSELASRHVTVALNGDGGDETFGGYDRYVAMQAFGRAHLPAPLAPLLRRTAKAMSRFSTGRLPSRLERLAEVACSTSSRRYFEMVRLLRDDLKSSLYTDQMRAATDHQYPESMVTALFSSSSAHTRLDKILDVDVHSYLPNDLLVKVDIASMAHSLEARSPLLDHHLMEFVASLPAAMKIRGRDKKRVLKRAVRDWLPKEILTRKKMGFAVPIDSWLRGELNDMAHDILLDNTAKNRGILSPRQVGQMLKSHEGGIDRGRELWPLLCLELWFREIHDSQPSSPLSSGCR